MSLWSPVDLVSGGTGTRNANIANNSINSSHFRIVEEVLGQLYSNPTSASRLSSAISSIGLEGAKREDKRESSAHNFTSSLLYDHLLRRSSSKSSDNSNAITKNVNSPINCFVMSNNDTSSTITNLRNGKRPAIKGLIDINELSREINCSQSLQSVSSAAQQALPLVKPKASDEVSENCDKDYKSINKYTMSNNEDDDSVMPLNLCVKKSRNDSEASFNVNKNKIFPKSSPTLNNVITTINTPQYNPLSQQSRKRGRKPKSLLATTSNLIVPSTATTLNNLIDNKPRKRGRPPTLSPPLCSLQSQQPLAAHSSNLSKALSSSGAFQHHFPYAVLNTPLQPGWPSLSSTGQLIFPDKLNGSEARHEINNYKLNKNSANEPNISESSDNIDSLASDSESNEDESDSDTGSQTSGNKTSDSHDRRSFGQKPLPDENEIRIPLQHGWKRQTKILSFSKSGVKGEVVYYTPCGKKLKSYPEVIRYLSKNGITNVSKDNFSFSSKPIVGDFLQRVHEFGNEVLLGERELRAQIEAFKKARLGHSAALSLDKKRKVKDGLLITEELQQKDTQLRNLIERTRAVIPRDAKRLKLEEMKKLRDNETNHKEQERVDKIELMRLEKVAKAQQIEEARRKRREELERQRQEEMVRKVQEREIKRQQLEIMREQEMQRRRELLIMADLERERRRQHMMLVRALEAHKKQEEKERKKEEILAEKRAIQERKMQKKRLEIELLKELKKPVDDMILKDLQPLPTLNRIPGLKLPGKAFSDTLMVFEFLHNFGETLGFDMESLPSLNTLTMALLNADESAEEELLSIVHHLLVCAIEDPGIPTNITTVMGQKLKDAPITNYNITEILRLYFQAFDYNIRDDAKEHRIESRMVELLDNAIPFLSLNANQKSEILAFLCNELLCNQSIVKQIDDNIETVANIRRDKWVHENELRKWKNVKLKREKKTNEQLSDDKKNELETADDESGDSDAEEAQNGSITTTNNDSEDEPGLSNEEIDKKIDKLNKQCNQMNNKLNKATNMYRVTSLGQDRYRRRYWVLPNAGGVFVEGLESGEAEELANNIWDETKDNEILENTVKTDEILTQKDEENVGKDENETDIELSKNCSVQPNEEIIEDKEDNDIKPSNITENEELDEVKSELNKCENPEDMKITKIGSKDDLKIGSKDDLKIGSKDDLESDSEINSKIASNISSKVEPKVEPKTDLDSKLDSKINSKFELKTESKVDLKKQKKSDNVQSDLQSSLPNDSQWMSPFFASMLGSLMLNDNGNGSSSNGLPNSQLPLSFPLGLDLANNHLSGSVSKPNESHKTWFSVLPRMPCDNETISESSKLDSVKVEDSTHSKQNKLINKSNESSVSSQQKLLQQSPLSSLMNGLPSNLFMQAFLYPHILSSLFNQHSLGGGPCPPDTSPFSFGSSSATTSKVTSNAKLNSTQNTETTNSDLNDSSTKQTPNTTLNSESIADCEVDICPSLQKRIAQQKEQQFDRQQKIPMEYQLGWWRITDSSQLKIMIEVLHGRGVRERQLQKHLMKYLTYASQSCKSNVAELEITDMDRHIAQNCAFGAPKDGKCPHDMCSESEWCKEVAVRFDIAVLEQIEALEEKIATSSMQIRQWKPMPRISCNESMRFSAAASFVERNKQLSENRPNNSADDNLNDVHNSDGDSNSSLIINESQCQSSNDVKSGEINPVSVGRERLLALEAVIERRYLKPPLGFKSNTILISTGVESGQMDDFNDNAADENATSGLLRWRDALREAKCSAEIALCLHFLESCIAWDKSIMRASCQFCGSGENEAQLLLCDGCDKGYHTYCFKPKMETIPDGDWFCFECQNKNTIDKVCVVCGKKGKLLNCDSCAKVFHPNCLDPPVTKPLKGKWICHMCGRKPKKPNQQKTSKKSLNSSSEEKQSETVLNTSTPVNNTSNSTTTKESGRRLANGTNKTEKDNKKEKKSKPSKESKESTEMNICKTILDEMENHDDSWPFLLPVNTKQFPTYKKIIKKPMDTTTIRAKLDSHGYKNKEEFAVDIRLIFDNCVTFNEDESPVGQAGHNLRAFFEIKWKELCGT